MPAAEADSPAPVKRARRSFRPSLKGTIAGIVAILVVLAANIGIISFILSHQIKKAGTSLTTVVTTPDQLGKIGSSEGPAGQNLNLVVTPNAQFKGQVTIDKAVDVGDRLTAPTASLTQLQAGNSSLAALNVSGGTSLSDASLRGNLNVTGLTNLQGAVTVAKILTAAALNVTGNLTVGGSFVTNDFSARSLTSISTLTIGGHVVTAGSAPGGSRGSALRAGDNASVSGNDATGTISYGAGTGQPTAGDILTVTFVTAYSATPHITITAVSADANCAKSLVYISGKSRTGFTVALASPPSTFPGFSCQFDYQVMQ